MLTNRDYTNFQLALKVAELSQCNYKHGSIIASGKRVFSVACNCYRTHPVQQRYRSSVCTIHAEARAIIRARADITNTICYSARIDRNNKPTISKPCQSCYDLIYEAGIAYVVYHNETEIVKMKVC